MSDSGDYQQAWKRYRLLGRIWIALFILYVPVVVGTAILSAHRWRTLVPAIVVAVLWMVGTLFLGARITMWRCPKCGQPYSGTLLRSKGIFARHCVHCGLAKYANATPAAN